MDLIWRIAQVIVPVFFIVAVGYGWGRRARPDLTAFNRIVLDVLSPLLVYTALAGKEFRLADHALLLAGGAALILLTGLVAWGVARAESIGMTGVAAGQAAGIALGCALGAVAWALTVNGRSSEKRARSSGPLAEEGQ